MSHNPKPGQLSLFPGLRRWEAPPESAERPAEDGADERRQHDLIFKTTFHHFFKDLVELAQPEFARRVDLDDVEFLEQEAFSDFPEGLRRIADLVARVKSLDGQGRLVLVQVETEGEFLYEMDERAFYYFLYLRIKYRLPVLLIVVFLRGGPKALSMREFVDQAEGVEVCRFRYVAFCLEQNRAEEFVDLPQPLAPGLAALMTSKWDPVEKKLRCLEAIRRTEVDEARRFVLVNIVDLYVELNEAQAELFAAELAKQDHEEVREMVITWEDALAASKTEGVVETMRSSILRVLTRRLEAVPASVREKLDAIQSLERLEEVLDQAAVARSVDEIVLEP
jgi:hypothetical protein